MPMSAAARYGLAPSVRLVTGCENRVKPNLNWFTRRGVITIECSRAMIVGLIVAYPPAV